MEAEKLIEISGWLTLDSNNHVYFHDEAPYQHIVTVENFHPVHPSNETRVSWFSDGNFVCLGNNDKLDVAISVEKPLRVKLQIWSKE